VAVPVTATVITFNETANIKAALESLSWADEIVVVDSESTDDTVAIARTRVTTGSFRWMPTSASRRHWPGSSPR
jgi:GT2 family glycosyltransferase